jgi:hypothetical protein
MAITTIPRRIAPDYPHDQGQRPRRHGRQPAAATEAAEEPTAMTVTTRLGTGPTLREDLDRALGLIAEQAVQIAEQALRIAALEAGRDADDQVDGPTPAPLPPNWKPIKTAAELVGYSESGLRKAIKRQRDARWWEYSGGRLFVDIDHCPRPVRT